MKKLSQYVHYTKATNGGIILLDSNSGNIFRIPESASQRFIDAINHPENISDDNILVQKNIIIDVDSFNYSIDLFEEFAQKKTIFIWLFCQLRIVTLDAHTAMKNIIL